MLFTHLYHKDPLDPEEVLATLHEYRDLIAPYLADTSAILTNALKEGKRVLVEGQLGTLKDPDMGIYPMVTSSYTTAAFAAVGAKRKNFGAAAETRASTERRPDVRAGSAGSTVSLRAMESVSREPRRSRSRSLTRSAI